MSSKDVRIKELEDELQSLEAEYLALTQDYNRKWNEQRPKAPEIPTQPKRPNIITGYDRWWDVTVRFWPLSWSGGRFYRFNWQKHSNGSGTREGQADFGPVSFSWNREVKR